MHTCVTPIGVAGRHGHPAEDGSKADRFIGGARLAVEELN